MPSTDAWQYERELLDPAVRRDAARLTALLDPDFREVGASGRYWNRDDIIAALAADPGNEPPQITQPETTVLSDDLVLLTYLASRPTRHTRRASLWRRMDGDWRIIYHQGTPANI
ncbi:MAG TPA: DUF4440 domain-containing protein [Jatrophihabitans sp.]|nr:DUF4440 domain-containing protein [Jatrophihabitans sp.]